jgi:hypothetical protein
MLLMTNDNPAPRLIAIGGVGVGSQGLMAKLKLERAALLNLGLREGARRGNSFGLIFGWATIGFHS